MLSSTYLSFFAIFAFVAYLIATDNSVAQFIALLSKIIEVRFWRMKWWLLNNPRNPIVKYLMWRRALKLAKEIENEIQMERQSRLSNNNSKIIE
jgi:hypothetical protein